MSGLDGSGCALRQPEAIPVTDPFSQGEAVSKTGELLQHLVTRCARIHFLDLQIAAICQHLAEHRLLFVAQGLAQLGRLIMSKQPD